MTAKDYCDMTLALRKDVRMKEELNCKYIDASKKITSDIVIIKVQNNGTVRPMADAVDAHADLNSVILMEINLLLNMLYVICKAVMFVDDPCSAKILTMFYIDCLPVSTVMKELDVTRATVFRRKKKALDMLRISPADMDQARLQLQAIRKKAAEN